MPKQGFKNQWIPICRVGDFVDASGTPVKIDDQFLNAAIANFNAADHEPPICVGHPKMDAPAYGWTRELRQNGEVLEAKFADTYDEFEKMVEQGLFRKRSAAFYTNPPLLKHVGFLGAKPPAIKGLKNIQFNDGDSVTVEVLFNEENKTMEEKDVNTVAESIFDKLKGLFKHETAPSIAPAAATASFTASFSEADAKKMIETAVAAAKAEAKQEAVAEFAEQVKNLTETVNASSASGRRAEITQFVESIPAESAKHYLKNSGVVEFLEACAIADDADQEKAVVCFSEGADGKREEFKFSRLEWAKDLFSALPRFIEFGESFGNLKATGEADKFVNPQELGDLREGFGVKAATGGEK